MFVLMACYYSLYSATHPRIDCPASDLDQSSEIWSQIKESDRKGGYNYLEKRIPPKEHSKILWNYNVGTQPIMTAERSGVHSVHL